MAKEIERKFLLKNDSWRSEVCERKLISQGYVFIDKGVMRVRISDKQAFVTIKSKLHGISRNEYEYPIPLQDAVELLKDICDQRVIKKVRHIVCFDKKQWEVDEFLDQNSGLIVAEIELDTECEVFSLPDWLGKEVTDDMRYYNSNLVRNPFSNW